MFFIGVFGINNRSKKIKEVSFKCTGCLNKRGELVENSNVFEFFFIPIFKFSKKYILTCTKCGSMYRLNDSSVKKIIETEKVAYEDIEEVIYENRICECGEKIEKGYEYCPKCGRKL
ncbi:zinc ribbon domain-containing protein [uncultured Ilyobacter sp.]|uniref:zinc ribbon domain-containing protein n=1 Tax=uncultured Ilyobacter sp. TaxID=544433 RepID=UPI0029C0BA97|nr:zinc ribbon domain-containing protein [uncultured Ilyobacter sp.]